MTVYWIRHGEIASNRSGVYAGTSDEPLTEVGRGQAAGVVDQMAEKAVEAVYSSPIARARETASYLATARHKPVIVADSLKEIVLGPWQGLSEDEVVHNFPREWEIWLSRPAELSMPGRETLAEIAGRVGAFLDQVQGDGPVCAFSHFAVIRVAILLHQRRDLNEYKSVHVPNCAVFPLEYP